MGKRIAVAMAAALCSLAVAASAAVPVTVSIEGRLLTAAGGPVSDGDYAVTFALYASKDAKAAAWDETMALAVKNAGFRHVLGGKKSLSADVLDGKQVVWLGVTVGTDPELPRVPLHAVLYARRAAVAEKLACSGCVTAAHLAKGAVDAKLLANGSVTADKVAFAWAKADKAGGTALFAKSAESANTAKSAYSAKLAADVQCTGCVSVAELALDGDVKLGKFGLTASNIVAAQVSAQQFIGDGSKLTGIALPKGDCKAGLAVAGIAADGSLKCVQAGAKLPSDGLSTVSAGTLSNVFSATYSIAKSVAIADNDPIGASAQLSVPDNGVIKAMAVNIDVQNSDISGLQVTLFDPNNKAYLLHDKTGSGKALKASYPPAKPKSGDLLAWLGDNPKGTWRLKVVDLKKGPGGKDGAIAGFSLKVTWISNKKVAATGVLSVGGNLELSSSAKAAVACSAATAGRVWFDKSGPALRICDGADWQLVQFAALCGNGKLNAGETCDDGNTVSGDGCTAGCKKNVCGDGILHKGVETCDDGNTKSKDGCSDKCALEIANSCKQLLSNGKTQSGNYTIDPDGTGPAKQISVYCDMKSDGGGWTRVGADDFEAGTAGWSGAGTNTCGKWGNILGGYGKKSSGHLDKTYTWTAVAHKEVRVTLDYVRIDSWDGETAEVRLDGKLVWSKKGAGGNTGSQVCGNGQNGYTEEKWPVAVKTGHADNKVQVRASSTLDEDDHNESFGIDNVVVWIR